MDGTQLFNLIKQSDSVHDALNQVVGKTPAEIQSKKGNLYEKIWDLVFKLGFYSELPSDKYNHHDGNVNTCNLKQITDLENYINSMSVFSKGLGGSSDITLQHAQTGAWIFMSSKFYLEDKKHSIDDYDVEKLIAISKQYAHKYKDVVIYLLVNDKHAVLNKIKTSHSTNDYIGDNIAKILDLQDLETHYKHMKLAIQNYEIGDLNDAFGVKKPALNLRFHQDMITSKQLLAIEAGEKQLLLGAKARSGKTYCVGGIVSKLYEKNKKINVVVITPAPRETISQFTDGLFNKFRNFNNINVLEITSGKDLVQPTLSESNIIVISKQLLDGYVGDKTVVQIANLNLDCIIIDESHFHGTTAMTKNILTSYTSPNTVKLYLSATYCKPLSEWKVPEDCQHYWDIEDEQLCKRRDIAGLVAKHGQIVNSFVTPDTADSVLAAYDAMPEMHIITTSMEKPKYNAIKSRIQDTSYGFSNTALLSGNFPSEVDATLEYMTGSEKERDYPNGDMSCFGRIKRHSIANDSRTGLNNGDFSSQLWFLPFGPGMKIDATSKHLKARMMKNRILNRYEIVIVNSKKEYAVKDIKLEIAN